LLSSLSAGFAFSCAIGNGRIGRSGKEIRGQTG